MYKVILVDDDELVRVGLESLVQFSQKGFQIIDALSSTQAALKSIYKNQPDVVITDMYMPECNGIQLIREGKRLCPTAIFVVLSCHNNIDFIKEALAAGAFDYLLKSTIVNPESAEQLLDKITTACKMRAGLPAAQDSLSNFKGLLLSYLKGEGGSSDAVRQALYTKGFDVAGSGIYLSCIQFNRYDAMHALVGDEEELLSKLEAYIDGFLSEYGAGFSVYYENGCFLLLQQIQAATVAIPLDSRLLGICERLRICIKNTFLHTCSIYVGSTHTPEQLSTAAQTLLSFLSANPLMPDFITRSVDFSPSSDSSHDELGQADPINEVLRYININYTNAITLDELANIAHFSKYHLCRKFKNATQMGIITYILTLRINKAKELLLDADCDYIFEVAQKVGFNDTSYFNRTFKRVTGYTPNEYQNMNRK